MIFLQDSVKNSLLQNYTKSVKTITFGESKTARKIAHSVQNYTGSVSDLTTSLLCLCYPEKCLGTGFKKIGTGKILLTGIKNIRYRKKFWYRKKVSVSVKILGTVTL